MLVERISVELVMGLQNGMVLALVAAGFTLILGVMNVVNFAHGEMMTIAMYLAIVLFTKLGLDPLLMLVPIAAVLCVGGYFLQGTLINRFITRPEHSQFLLLVAIAIIMVNVGWALGGGMNNLIFSELSKPLNPGESFSNSNLNPHKSFSCEIVYSILIEPFASKTNRRVNFSSSLYS